MFSKCGAGKDSWGVPWTARRSNQSTLKEINPDYSLEGLMLRLKPQYIGQLMQRTDSLEKTLMLGKIQHKRKREWQRMIWLDAITNRWTVSFSKLQDLVMDREAWHAAIHGAAKSWTLLSNWTKMMLLSLLLLTNFMPYYSLKLLYIFSIEIWNILWSFT